jgi:redox-sensitive bicupin YhaK (pirin superfamily)
MLWNEDIPRVLSADDHGRTTEVTLIAGTLDDRRAPSPPPKSWASRADTDVAIWSIRMDAGARFTLPPAASAETVRTIYFFRGASLRVAGQPLASYSAAVLQSDADVSLEAGAEACEILLLQGRPIGKPVVQHGPFVMNTRDEIQRAIADYQRTRYGGWPWESDDPVHGPSEGRFARHADGQVERRDSLTPS